MLKFIPHRSGLAEECSGPIPSRPWGKSRTSPVCRTHLDCPDEINWSMMHCAVLLKSPNYWHKLHKTSLESKSHSKQSLDTISRWRKGLI